MLMTDRRHSTHSAELAARGVVNFPSFLPSYLAVRNEYTFLEIFMKISCRNFRFLTFLAASCFVLHDLGPCTA